MKTDVDSCTVWFCEPLAAPELVAAGDVVAAGEVVPCEEKERS